MAPRARVPCRRVRDLHASQPFADRTPPAVIPKLHTLVCSTRPGRVGLSVATWFHDLATRHGKFDCALVDLAEFGLPVFDEPEHPRLRKYHHDHTKRWSASVEAADAFVFVTPEYNYGPPPALVNAMNYLVSEWQYKPVGFVGYGGISGAMRAIQAEKLMVTTFKMMPMMEAVVVPNVVQHLDADKRFAATDMHASAAGAMLDELLRWTGAMRTLRAPRAQA